MHHHHHHYLILHINTQELVALYIFFYSVLFAVLLIFLLVVVGRIADDRYLYPHDLHTVHFSLSIGSFKLATTAVQHNGNSIDK